jgi:hypothetical protein
MKVYNSPCTSDLTHSTRLDTPPTKHIQYSIFRFTNIQMHATAPQVNQSRLSFIQQQTMPQATTLHELPALYILHYKAQSHPNSTMTTAGEVTCQDLFGLNWPSMLQSGGLHII